MLYHRRVSPNVGRNPVAQAVARRELASAVLDLKIKLYLLAQGESCESVLIPVGQTLAVAGLATELDPALGQEVRELKVLRGGLSACQQLVLADRWDSLQVVAIEGALDAAMVLAARVKPRFISEAFRRLSAVHM